MPERARKYRYFILVSGSHHAIEQANTYLNTFYPRNALGSYRKKEAGGGGGGGGKHNEIIQIDTLRKSLKNNEK